MAWTQSMFLFSATFYTLLVLVRLWLARRVIRQRPVQSSEEQSFDLCQFTIVQPILSGDPLLAATLAENASQLPNCPFLWLVDDDDSEAKAVSTHIKDSVDRRDLQIILCPAAPVDVNPKSFKLELALAQVKTTYFVVLDDDTMITASSLQAAHSSLVCHDLATGLPTYQRGANVWSDLVAHFVNNNSVTTYLPLLNFFAPLSINGMFYVAKTETLRELGGFSCIQHLLCDDYAVAQWFRCHGKTIHQDTSRQRIATSITSARRYRQLMHRWMSFALLLTGDQPLKIQILLATFLGLPPILLTLALALSVWHAWTFVAMGIVLAIRQATIWVAHRSAFGKPLSTNLGLSLLAELLQPLHLVSAACVPYIRWRGKLVRVSRDQRYRQCD
ncbi:MAG: glycosyltransferase [Pirellulaceae bacterium]